MLLEFYRARLEKIDRKDTVWIERQEKSIKKHEEYLIKFELLLRQQGIWEEAQNSPESNAVVKYKGALDFALTSGNYYMMMGVAVACNYVRSHPSPFSCSENRIRLTTVGFAGTGMAQTRQVDSRRPKNDPEG